MTGAVAAIAEPPQMEEPTPTNVEILLGICIHLWSINEMRSEVRIVLDMEWKAQWMRLPIPVTLH